MYAVLDFPPRALALARASYRSVNHSLGCFGFFEFCDAPSAKRLDTAPAGDPTSLTVPVLFPAMDAKDVCPDTPLRITFTSTPVIGSGKIEVLDASDETLVESIDLSVATRSKTIGGIPNFNYHPVLISDNQAAIYLLNHALDYNKTYVVKISHGA